MFCVRQLSLHEFSERNGMGKQPTEQNEKRSAGVARSNASRVLILFCWLLHHPSAAV
jgi:hypothetical protein